MAEVYYFDGSGGCDLCRSSSTYSVEVPAPPHPHCACPVEECELEDIVHCAFEIRDVYIVPSDDEIHDTWELPNCESTEDEEFEIEIGDLDEDLDEMEFDLGLLEQAEAEGWEEPEVERESVTVTVPGLHIATVETVKTRHSEHFEGEVWLVCEVGDEVIESQVGTKTGDFARTTDIDIVDTSTEVCPDFA
jgi:hypothetical protein